MTRADEEWARRNVASWPWDPHDPPLWKRALRSRQPGNGQRYESGGGGRRAIRLWEDTVMPSAAAVRHDRGRAVRIMCGGERMELP